MALTDMGFMGPVFTWNNRRNEFFNIQERLDRSLVFVNWCNLYPNAFVQHMEDMGSDHRPLLLSISPFILTTKRFYFDSRWISNPRTSQIIKLSLKQNFNGSTMFNVCSKLKLYMKNLFDWNRKNATNSKVRIAHLESRLATVKDNS
ncbi:hypothetical protein MANES_15G185432v8 [Manihot esculenta]|uniref:Uncharacterized protein n=1 Tax=Manihot esculenta TaxID=3983 RepID=A0ACB7GDE6_MANES|nr:hypothetical protein MANES_15G185432v8 [Manihot esculenta]